MMRFAPALLALTVASVTVSNVRAASDDECAGWLCIAVGFTPPECAAAKSAMLQRLFELKSPLPSFGECSADDDSNGYDAHMGVAARIGNSQPPEYVIGTRCRYDDNNQVEGDSIPAGCTATYRWVTATQHGVPLGPTIFTRLGID